jgi:hypothetical protein
MAFSKTATRKPTALKRKTKKEIKESFLSDSAVMQTTLISGYTLCFSLIFDLFSSVCGLKF